MVVTNAFLKTKRPRWTDIPEAVSVMLEATNF
jgi:hypothetical protein